MLDSLEKSTVDAGLLSSALAMGPTARIERMREAYLGLKPSGSIARIRIETRVMKETEGEPTVIRRAKAFAAIARENCVRCCWAHPNSAMMTTMPMSRMPG